jgi:hypothetical protein
VVANTNTQAEWQGEIVVDYALNPVEAAYEVVFSNLGSVRAAPNAVVDKPAGSVRVTEVSGAITHGPARTISVTLRPMEAQILARRA